MEDNKLMCIYKYKLSGVHDKMGVVGVVYITRWEWSGVHDKMGVVWCT